ACSGCLQGGKNGTRPGAMRIIQAKKTPEGEKRGAVRSAVNQNAERPKSTVEHARQTDDIARHRETKPAPRLAVGTEPNSVPRRIVTLRLCERRQSRFVSSHTYLHSRM